MAPKKPLYFHPRLDASENIFLRRELENVRAQAFDIKFPALKGRLFVPIDNSVNTGAETNTFNTLEELGEAQITSDYATEAPRVDVAITDETLRIRGIVAAYGYSFQEVRNSMFAGRSLPNLKAITSRRIIERKLDTVLLLGDTAWKLKGLFTLTGTTTHTIALGKIGSKLWANKTSDEIAVDMHAIVNSIVTGTIDIEHPDTLILPLTAFNRVNQQRMGDGSDKTILSYFLETNAHITSVESSTRLESNTAWTGRQMVAYQRSPMMLQGVHSQEYEQLAPEVKGFETVVNCHARTGGVELYYPKAVSYADDF